MRIELGEVAPNLVTETLNTDSAGRVTLVSTPTSNTTRWPVIGSSTIAFLEVAIAGTTGPAQSLNQTTTSWNEVIVLKSGQRITQLTTSDFSYTSSPVFQSADAATFQRGIYNLQTGLTAGSAFETRFLSGNDTISGNGFANQLGGGTGNDRISGGGGADLIDGGAGTDTSVYRELPRGDYLVTRRSDGTVFVATRDGTNDRNIGIENLEFTDGTVAASSIAYLPGHTAVPGSAVQPVYRFYNSRDKAFFYTNSASERDMIIRESTDPSFTPSNGLWPYFYQGTTFEQAHTTGGSVPVFRFYNTRTGHHFFTTSASERDLVLRESTDPAFGQPGLWPFVFEGEGFRAYADANHRDAAPVFRFYSPNLDRHFFTASTEEAAQIRLTGQWNDEGIGFWGETAG